MILDITRQNVRWVASHFAYYVSHAILQNRKAEADRPRRLKPGTVLLREYQGERHTVTVVPNGYLWRETTYASLSTIARAITGTAWSEPRGVIAFRKEFFPKPIPGKNSFHIVGLAYASFRSAL